jgi:hypothetical protein
MFGYLFEAWIISKHISKIADNSIQYFQRNHHKCHPHFEWNNLIQITVIGRALKQSIVFQISGLIFLRSENRYQSFFYKPLCRTV